jgi:sugar O-acyltransferase (sialic acid O-acetyltransferase NeuD family)
MKEIIIIGAGGHAAELRDYIGHYNHSNPPENIRVKGYLDDDEDNFGKYAYPEPFLGSIKNHLVDKNELYLMGIANLAYRRPIIEKFVREGAKFIGLIHPTALVSPSARIGKGVVISHNASVGPKAVIGDYCVLNSRCTIGHDSVLGRYNFISPQVAISGNTIIGDENMLGTNACTIPAKRIGNNNVVAAGMVIYKDIGDNETVIFRHKERLIVRDKAE